MISLWIRISIRPADWIPGIVLDSSTPRWFQARTVSMLLAGIGSKVKASPRSRRLRYSLPISSPLTAETPPWTALFSSKKGRRKETALWVSTLVDCQASTQTGTITKAKRTHICPNCRKRSDAQIWVRIVPPAPAVPQVRCITISLPYRAKSTKMNLQSPWQASVNLWASSSKLTPSSKSPSQRRIRPNLSAKSNTNFRPNTARWWIKFGSRRCKNHQRPTQEISSTSQSSSTNLSSRRAATWN